MHNHLNQHLPNTTTSTSISQSPHAIPLLSHKSSRTLPLTTRCRNTNSLPSMISPFQALISAVDSELQRGNNSSNLNTDSTDTFLNWGLQRKVTRRLKRKATETQGQTNLGLLNQTKYQCQLVENVAKQSKFYVSEEAQSLESENGVRVRLGCKQEQEEEESVNSLACMPLFVPQKGSQSPASIFSMCEMVNEAETKSDNDGGIEDAHASIKPGCGGTSCYRGVSWHTQTGKWKAQIKVNGKDVNLGRHKDEVEAAKAYDKAAICARGVKDAKLNFPLSTYANQVLFLTSTPLEQLAAQLRGVEERLNSQTSKYHGVRLNKRTNRWEAYIRVSGKHVHLGCHDCEVAAAQVYDQALVIRCMFQSSIGNNVAMTHKTPETNYPVAIYTQFLAQLCGQPLFMYPPLGTPPMFCAVAPLQDKYVQNLIEKCRSVEYS